MIVVKSVRTFCLFRRLVDPERTASTIYDQVVEEYNHKDYFQCKFSGFKLSGKPKNARVIAGSLAKHSRSILQKRNKPINSVPNAPGIKNIIGLMSIIAG